MPRLNDSGMDGTDRNLVQAFALYRKKGVGRWRTLRRGAGSERMLYVPKAQIEPRPRIRPSTRLQPVKRADGAFEPDGGRVQRADRRERLIRTFKAQDRELAGGLIANRHVHRARSAGVAPQAEQRRMAERHCAAGFAPRILVHGKARPRPMIVDPLARYAVDDGRHRSIRAAPQRSGTRQRGTAAYRCRAPKRRRDA